MAWIVWAGKATGGRVHILICAWVNVIPNRRGAHAQWALRGGHIVVVPIYTSLMCIIKHYYYCAKEDEHSHQHVFRALKTEVESIVAQHIRDQQKI